MYIDECIYMYVYCIKHIYIYRDIYIYIHIHIYVYIYRSRGTPRRWRPSRARWTRYYMILWCIYIYIEREIDRYTYRERERDRERERERKNIAWDSMFNAMNALHMNKMCNATINELIRTRP